MYFNVIKPGNTVSQMKPGSFVSPFLSDIIDCWLLLIVDINDHSEVFTLFTKDFQVIFTGQLKIIKTDESKGKIDHWIC